MPYPHIRKAELRDYEAIWEIWMQDHIIQWMSFPKQTKEEFISDYARMAKTSDIYVLIDKINEEEKVVAVRRIKFGQDQYRHIAEYCSMGVGKEFQGKGYAKFLYQEFEKIARESGIKRIQLFRNSGQLRFYQAIEGGQPKHLVLAGSFAPNAFNSRRQDNFVGNDPPGRLWVAGINEFGLYRLLLPVGGSTHIPPKVKNTKQ